MLTDIENSRNIGAAVQVDVDALSGAVSTAISQAIRQHSNMPITGITTPNVPGAAHHQSCATGNGTTQVHSDDGQTSASGRKRR